MTVLKQDLQAMRAFYSDLRENADGAKNIYEIWEVGGAFGDSITPSVYCSEYQSHASLKLQSLTQEGDCIFSLGCGNAAVEGRLIKSGRRVRAIDFNIEAVRLAREKDVDATQADFMQMSGNVLNDVSLVYADGFVGHLFDREHGLDPVFEQLARIGLRESAHVVISNDAPVDSTLAVQPHGSVADFWYVSPDYVAQAMQRAGLQIRELYTFPYLRPTSGLRKRTICVGRKS